jgi:tetrapyrrole methylase family protein / MazG family protein
VTPEIVVIGLGPADEALLTLGTLRAVEAYEHRYLRTARHPAASAVPNAVALDHFYETHATFSDVYSAMVSHLFAEANLHGRILYAVPGSPAVAEHTVELLLAQSAEQAVNVTVIPALSFVDLTWIRLQRDPLSERVTIIDGHRFVDDIAGRPGPYLVSQCHSQAVLSEIKLALSEAVLDPSTLPPITVLQRLGLPDELITTVAWHELDQRIAADHLTSLYIPELPDSLGVAAANMHTLMRTLRENCPWDAEQTAASLAPYVLEEAAELVEAIEALGEFVLGDVAAGSPPGADGPHLHSVSSPVSGSFSDRQAGSGTPVEPDDEAIAHYADELGDVAFQAFFHACLAEEEGWFTLAEVLDRLHDRLVFRHPHVFPRDDFDASMIVTAEDISANWARIKAGEIKRPLRSTS